MTRLACPYHLAVEHAEWLRSTFKGRLDNTTPLFPTVAGLHAHKTTVIETFEAIGSTIGQLLHNAEGLRLFGGHTPRVTGAQAFAALGIEVNKIRILARHSGDTILRYVSDAPLKSLRSDLGLLPPKTTRGPTHRIRVKDLENMSNCLSEDPTAKELATVEKNKIEALRLMQNSLYKICRDRCACDNSATRGQPGATPVAWVAFHEPAVR